MNLNKNILKGLNQKTKSFNDEVINIFKELVSLADKNGWQTPTDWIISMNIQEVFFLKLHIYTYIGSGEGHGSGPAIILDLYDAVVEGEGDDARLARRVYVGGEITDKDIQELKDIITGKILIPGLKATAKNYIAAIKKVKFNYTGCLF